MDPTNLRYALNFRNWNFSKSYISQPSHKEAKKNQFLTKKSDKEIMNPINSQIWEKYSAPAIKSDHNTNITFVKYRFAILVEKKERNSKRRGKEREHPQNAPFHISYQPTRSRIHKKQSQLLKKEREN